MEAAEFWGAISFRDSSSAGRFQAVLYTNMLLFGVNTAYETPDFEK
jgi:hypothetical protein